MYLSAPAVFGEGDSSARRCSTSPPHQSAALTAMVSGGFAWIEPNCPPDSSAPKGKPTCFAALRFLLRYFSKWAYRACQSPSPGGEGGPAKPGRMRACLEDSTAWVIDPPAQGGSGILLPAVTTISPPHQSAPLTASPQGEAYVLCYVEVITTIFFYINLKGLPIAFPWRGRWASRRPGRMRASVGDSTA